MDGRAQVVVLTGLGSRLETSTGYAMETRGLTADLAAGTLQTDGALEVRAPYGSLTAGRAAGGIRAGRATFWSSLAVCGYYMTRR